jgi:hypothetical protein
MSHTIATAGFAWHGGVSSLADEHSASLLPAEVESHVSPAPSFFTGLYTSQLNAAPPVEADMRIEDGISCESCSDVSLIDRKASPKQVVD